MFAIVLDFISVRGLVSERQMLTLKLSSLLPMLLNLRRIARFFMRFSAGVDVSMRNKDLTSITTTCIGCHEKLVEK